MQQGASYCCLTDTGSTGTKHESVLQIRRTRTQLKVSQTEFQLSIFFASSHKEWLSLQLVSVRNWFPPFTEDYITDTQPTVWNEIAQVHFTLLIVGCCSSNSAQYERLTQVLTYATPRSSGVNGGCYHLWHECKEIHPSQMQTHRSFKMGLAAPIYHSHPPLRGRAKCEELSWKQNTGKDYGFSLPKHHLFLGSLVANLVLHQLTHGSLRRKREVCKS